MGQEFGQCLARWLFRSPWHWHRLLGALQLVAGVGWGFRLFSPCAWCLDRNGFGPSSLSTLFWHLHLLSLGRQLNFYTVPCLGLWKEKEETVSLLKTGLRLGMAPILLYPTGQRSHRATQNLEEWKQILPPKERCVKNLQPFLIHYMWAA